MLIPYTRSSARRVADVQGQLRGIPPALKAEVEAGIAELLPTMVGDRVGPSPDSRVAITWEASLA